MQDHHQLHEPPTVAHLFLTKLYGADKIYTVDPDLMTFISALSRSSSNVYPSLILVDYQHAKPWGPGFSNWKDENGFTLELKFLMQWHRWIADFSIQ